MSDRYHHGDLPNALRAAAAEVIEEQGLAHFSLREVARRAGVSHTAPAHHFGDTKGLLTSLAIEGFDALHDVTLAAREREDDPVAALTAMGVAYVSLATERPAHCQVMFRVDAVDTSDPALQESGMRAFMVLHDAMRTIIEHEQLDVDVDVAVELCWSTMQGLVVLEPKLAVVDESLGRPAVPTSERIARLTSMMLDGIRHSRSPDG